MIKSLSETLVKNAAREGDWASLKAHLDEISLSGSELPILCQHIRHCTDLICNYPRPKFETKRGKFFNNLKSYVALCLGSDAALSIDSEFDLIKTIEAGYKTILKNLDKTDISKKPPTVRASAALSRAVFEFADMTSKWEKAVLQMEQLNVMDDVQLTDDDGNPFSFDGVLEAISETLTLTLVMEAIKNDWIVDDVITLPSLVDTSEEERFMSGSTQYFAIMWRNWRRLENKLRYLGGRLKYLEGDEIPEEHRENLETIIEYVPEETGTPNRDAFDFISNRRLQDKIIQNSIQIASTKTATDKCVGLGAQLALPPAQYVSAEELITILVISDIVGYSLIEDTETPGGLQLIEWIRGYAVLKEFAADRLGINGQSVEHSPTGEDYLIRVTEAELVGTLVMSGLTSTAAEAFIRNTLLHRSSKDLFDCPIISVADGSYVIFSPSLLSMNLSMAVMSNLSNRSLELSKKGKAFEKVAHEVFKGHGLETFTFKANRGGQEFEYDAIVPWGAYLFVFECKNMSLSNNNPVQNYHFDRAVVDHARQVQRLADALISYPDIVEDRMGPEYSDLTIVPCVLHSLPYSRIGDYEGVYFTDISSVDRFLSDGTFNIKISKQVGDEKVVTPITLKKLWAGDSPTADEFRDQLDQPFQLCLSLHHLKYEYQLFSLKQGELIAVPYLARDELTPESVANALGLDAETIASKIAEYQR